MNPQRWQRVKALCHYALELAPDDRAAFLAASCADDRDLQRDVEALLAESAADDSFLEAPIWDRLHLASEPAAAAHGNGPSPAMPAMPVALRGDSPRPERPQQAGLAQIYGEAEPLLVDLLEARKGKLGPEHPNTLKAIFNLGQLYVRQGRFSAAEPLYADVLTTRRRQLGDEHPDTLAMMSHLGVLYSRQGRGNEAESTLASLLAICRRLSGDAHPDTLRATDSLGEEYLRRGDITRAKTSFVHAFEGRGRVLGKEHADTLRSMVNLAESYRQLGRDGEAESIFITALETQRRVLGHDRIDTFTTLERLAELYRRQEKFSSARKLLGEAMAGRARILGPNHPDTLHDVAVLGLIHYQQHDYGNARSVFIDQFRDDLWVEDTWQRYFGKSVFGAVLTADADYAEAERLLIAGYEGMSIRLVAIPADWRPAVDLAGHWILQLYAAWGAFERASEWRDRLERDRTASLRFQ